MTRHETQRRAPWERFEATGVARLVARACPIVLCTLLVACSDTSSGGADATPTDVEQGDAGDAFADQPDEPTGPSLHGQLAAGAGEATGGSYSLRGRLSSSWLPLESRGGTISLRHGPLVPLTGSSSALR